MDVALVAVVAPNIENHSIAALRGALDEAVAIRLDEQLADGVTFDVLARVGELPQEGVVDREHLGGTHDDDRVLDRGDDAAELVVIEEARRHCKAAA